MEDSHVLIRAGFLDGPAAPDCAVHRPARQKLRVQLYAHNILPQGQADTENQQRVRAHRAAAPPYEGNLTADKADSEHPVSESPFCVPVLRHRAVLTLLESRRHVLADLQHLRQELPGRDLAGRLHLCAVLGGDHHDLSGLR